ncbi:MAG: hypothetical protein V3R41_06405 [Gammaproteobacteria bacterium]
MSSENATWQAVRPVLKRTGFLTERIENSLNKGTPDTWWLRDGIAGVLELKHASSWPKREGTPLRLPHLTDDQCKWHTRWGQHRGLGGLLLQVGRDYLYFRSKHVFAIHDKTKQDLFRLADWAGSKRQLKQMLEEMVRDG